MSEKELDSNLSSHQKTSLMRIDVSFLLCTNFDKEIIDIFEELISIFLQSVVFSFLFSCKTTGRSRTNHCVIRSSDDDDVLLDFPDDHFSNFL